MIALPLPFALQPEELDILQPRDRLSLAQWAPKHRKLSPKTSHLAGDWSNDITPFMVEPMEWLSDVATRQVTIVACTQSGKTELGNNFLGWVVDESPAPFMCVMPTEATVVNRVETRIKPMFCATPVLRRHLPGGNAENINTTKQTVLDSMILYLAWSGSPAALGDSPVCYLWFDEAGKYPALSGREADPVSLGKKRTRTFATRSKVLVTSSPVSEGDLTDREYQAGDRCGFWVLCPICIDRHVPAWQNVQLDKTATGQLLTPKEYEAGGRARYVCPRCKKPWTEAERWQAVCAGRWAPEGCSVDPAGRIIGHITATTHRSVRINALMLWPGFVTVDMLAADWSAAMAAKNVHDLGPLQDFVNAQLAEPFKDAHKSTAIERARAHEGSAERGIVPAGVQMITTGTDLQLDHVWYVVVGWGYMSEAWLIDAGRLETGDTRYLENYQLVRSLITASWPLTPEAMNLLEGEAIKGEPRQLTMSPRCSAIDCAYQMDTVLDFCRKMRAAAAVPVRGDDTVKGRLSRAAKVAGGTLTRHDLNVNVIKDRIFRMLFETELPGTGFLHLWRGIDEEYLKHMVNEHQVTERRGRAEVTSWVKKNKNAPNHLWDALVYAFFAAEISGARLLPDPTAPAPQRRVGRLDRLNS